MKAERSFFIRAGAILGALVLLLIVGECGYKKLAKRPLDWDAVLKSVRREYPDVPQMTTAALAELMEQQPEGLVLLDTRDAEEFAVSHIAGARTARSLHDVKALEIAKEARIILYCSVGHRSSALAEKLQKAGYVNVANLEGSLFAWANEGRPIVTAEGKKTTRVHPYSERWGALLDATKVAPARSAE